MSFYLNFMAYWEPRLLEKQEDLVSLEKFVGKYNKPKHKKARESIDFLQEKGLLPLKYTSLLFREFNLLVSSVVWGGGLSLNSGYWNRPIGVICTSEEIFEPIRERIRPLEIEFKISKLRHYAFSEHGAAYLRLISCLDGIKFSKKSLDAFTLPSYLHFLSDNYSSICYEEKVISRIVLSDHLAVLLQNRASKMLSGENYRLALPKSNSFENSRSLGLTVVSFFETLYPKIGLDKNSVSPSFGSSLGFDSPYITFNRRHVFNAIEHYGLFHIEPNFLLRDPKRKISYKMR